ncbi:hypothetical protein LINGRAHAP2_LOCUS9897 [Linum grandiflorum]
MNFLSIFMHSALFLEASFPVLRSFRLPRFSSSVFFPLAFQVFSVMERVPPFSVDAELPRCRAIQSVPGVPMPDPCLIESRSGVAVVPSSRNRFPVHVAAPIKKCQRPSCSFCGFVGHSFPFCYRRISVSTHTGVPASARTVSRPAVAVSPGLTRRFSRILGESALTASHRSGVCAPRQSDPIDVSPAPPLSAGAHPDVSNSRVLAASSSQAPCSIQCIGSGDLDPSSSVLAPFPSGC